MIRLKSFSAVSPATPESLAVPALRVRHCLIRVLRLSSSSPTVAPQVAVNRAAHLVALGPA